MHRNLSQPVGSEFLGSCSFPIGTSTFSNFTQASAHLPSECGPQPSECGPHHRPLALHAEILPTACIPRARDTPQCALWAFTPGCRLQESKALPLVFSALEQCRHMAVLSKCLWHRSLGHDGQCAYLSGTEACRLLAWEIYNNSAIDTGFQSGEWVRSTRGFLKGVCAPWAPESLLVFTKAQVLRAYSKLTGSEPLVPGKAQEPGF